MNKKSKFAIGFISAAIAFITLSLTVGRHHMHQHQPHPCHQHHTEQSTQP
ncbi:MAG: hypothetical protein ACOYLH_03380 [Flavobacteriales bacterium]